MLKLSISIFPIWALLLLHHQVNAASGTCLPVSTGICCLDTDVDTCAKNACCDDYCTGVDCKTCVETPGAFSGQ